MLRVAQWAVPVILLSGIPLYNRYLGSPEKQEAWKEYQRRQVELKAARLAQQKEDEDSL